MLEESRVGIAIDFNLRNKDLSDCYDPNTMAQLVNSALCAGGLGQVDLSAPFRDIITPGMTVLLKPNWVSHINNSGTGNECLVTHPEFIKAVISELIKAQPGRIIIADAPIQGCNFDEVVTESWKKKITDLSFPVPIEFIDFRRTVAVLTPTSFSVAHNKRDISNYVLFDLGSDSLLEPITSKAATFRVSCYNPDILADTHGGGHHQYLIAREIFDSDVVINLPKLKTHRKAGMTAALKNLVGINGDKDYLPHHRIGGADAGGDCYKRSNILKCGAEKCLDSANRNINSPKYTLWKFFMSLLMRLHKLFSQDNELDGGWSGNDTVWRMVLDLNRISIYGDGNGQMFDTPQRKIYSITDGIVAGEGNGPLSPMPLKVGMISFANSSVFADIAHSAIMRFDWSKIPTIRGAFTNFRFPLTLKKPSDLKIVFNGSQLSIDTLAQQYGVNFVAATGWQGEVELLKSEY